MPVQGAYVRGDVIMFLLCDSFFGGLCVSVVDSSSSTCFVCLVVR